jgi:hypothetical protein
MNAGSKVAFASVAGLTVIVLAFLAFAYGHPRVQAQQQEYSTTDRASRYDAGGARWEYCVITRSGVSASLPRGTYALTYLRASGPQSVPIDETATERGGLAKVVGKLGDDGWELVGAGPIEFKPQAGGEALYFKRIKQ